MIRCQAITRNYAEFAALRGVHLPSRPRPHLCAARSQRRRQIHPPQNPRRPSRPHRRQSLGRRARRHRRFRRTQTLARRGPRDSALFDELTIEEHLRLSGPIYGLTRKTTADRTVQLLRVLGIYDTRDTFIKDSSHGMRKKTALAAALLHNPAVVLLDEPFEGVDPATADSLRRQLRAMAERGITVLLSSHILSMVDRIADQIVILRRGELAWNSETGELPRSLESLYFELAEDAILEDLPWLGSQPS